MAEFQRWFYSPLINPFVFYPTDLLVRRRATGKADEKTLPTHSDLDLQVMVCATRTGHGSSLLLSSCSVVKPGAYVVQGVKLVRIKPLTF